MEVLKGLTSTKALSEVYPVGSIYMSTEPTSPASLFGGSWSQLEEGQFLMNTKLASHVNQPTPAGLPNIIGNFTHRNISSANATASGPFSVETSSMTYSTGWNNYDNEQGYIKFDASAYNSIYGNSATVQPYSLSVYMWKRIHDRVGEPE